MYKRRPTTSSGRSLSGMNSVNSRGSDIVAPNNTSLIVQRSRMSDDQPTTELPKSVMAVLYESDSDTESIDLARPSTSIAKSLSEKAQSTPRREKNALIRTSTEAKQRADPSQNDLGLFSTPEKTDCFFVETLSACGTTEVRGDGSFKLSVDQAVFCRRLHEKVTKDKSLDQFNQSLDKYWQNYDNLRKLLMLTQTSEDCEVARGPVQEPLMRLLLMTDCLQPKILEMLLSMMQKISKNSDDAEGAPLISGILRQARCLNRVAVTPLFAVKVCELISQCSALVGKEIIFMLPELVTENERSEAATKLVTLLHEGSDLTPVVIDSLGNLALSEKSKSEVRNEILCRMDRYPLFYLPSIVQFVLNSIEQNEAAPVVKALRQHLSFPQGDQRTQLSQSQVCRKKKSEVGSCLCKIFENLKNALMASKYLTDAWLKEIVALTKATDSRPVDLIVLIIIHGFIIGRKKNVITVIKGRVRADIFTFDYVCETFKLLRPALLDNHTELLEMASTLLKSFETNIADFAIALYRSALNSSNQFVRQDVISDIVANITSGTVAAVKNALELLIRMRENDASSLNAYASTFMTSMRVLPKLDLPLARKLADIVTSVVMTKAEEDSGLIEELLIFIRKQMSSWQEGAQQRGVIAAIMVIKHSILNVDEPSFYEKFELNFLLKSASGRHNSVSGFFLEELGSVLHDLNSRPAFLSTWTDRIYNYTLEHYYAADLDLECYNFPLSLQYSMENSGNLVFPIVGFLLKPDENPYIDILCVPAAVRLLWSSEKDLTRIKSLLCAAVILPDASVFDKFMTLSVSDQKIIMDCLFLCANYFIEAINALSLMKAPEQVIIRLKQLIELRILITKHVGLIPEYSPPPCQFHMKMQKLVIKKPTGDGKKGRKRKANGEEVDHGNATHVMDSSVLPSTSAAAPSDAIADVAPVLSDPTDLSACVSYFRDLSEKAYRLLRMELKLCPTKVFKKKKMSGVVAADVSWSYRPEDKPELGPSDTLFLLQSYLAMSDAILREKPCFVQKKTAGVVEAMPARMFIVGCAKLMPRFCQKLEVASGYCKDLLDANDGIWDAAGCYPPESVDIKMCYVTLLNIISDIVAWKGFHCSTNLKYLTDNMAGLSRSNTPAGSQASVTALAMKAAQHLASYTETLPLLWAGVCLTRATHSCILLSGSKNFSLIGELCGKLLTRPWFTLTGSPDGGVAYNQHLESLVRLYLSSSADTLETLARMAETALEEVPNLVSKDTSVPSFSAVNRGNFPVMYRAMCEALANVTAEEVLKRSGDDEASLVLWTDVVKTLNILSCIAKERSSTVILSALLKRSLSVIQSFLSKGLPVMESALRVKSKQVLEVFRTLQSVTRFFNVVGCDSKKKRDSVVTGYMPVMRALCEKLTLAVKGVLILNKVPLDCFEIRELKNRDLDGNTLSQSTIADSEEGSEDMPPEEISDNEPADEDDEPMDEDE